LPYFNQLAGKNIDFNFYDGKVWMLLTATGIFTALVAGSYPSFFLSSFKPIKVLKGSFINRKGGGLRRMLVTVQFIISIFFIVATIVVYKQINFVHDRPIGYDKDNLVDINATGDLSGKFDLFKNEMQKISGVTNISAGNDNVINFGGSITGMDYPGKTPDENISVIVSNVGYNWTKTLQIPIAEGRDFDPSFGTDSNACIINEAAVKRMNLKEPVIGDIIGGKTVIGVFKDFVYNNPSGIIAPMVISLQTNNFPHFFVRIANNNDWHITLSKIEAAAKKLNPDYPFDFSFVNDNYQQRFEQWNSWGSMATLFACMAVFIAALGLFGLASFVAERRSKEVSIRKVFGADSKAIWLLLSRDFFKPVLIATAIVIPLSIVISYKFLLNITYHTPLEWWMFALAVTITIMIALITVSYQAIKAAIANPVKSLRTE
ncbi:MAG TPA: FtsX-like permease family protein, partial [Parafilimonas sp.]|nr:FtsX-like permease family protein [Parafilimonas sp.]